MAEIEVPPGVDPNVTTAGRVYSYNLNAEEGQFFEIDKQVADDLRSRIPEIRDMSQASRIFVRRATRWMVRQGISQIIDLGSGLPTDGNTHEVAQEIDPEARVVYVDNDAMTRAHAEHLLKGTANVAFLHKDATRPDEILNDPETKRLIDFSKPVGFMLASVIHLIGDEHEPQSLVRRYMEAVPSGSYLALEHFTADGQDPAKVRGFNEALAPAGQPVYFREPEVIRSYFDGLELVPPPGFEDREVDLVWSNQWGTTEKVDLCGSWLRAGVARKP